MAGRRAVTDQESVVALGASGRRDRTPFWDDPPVRAGVARTAYGGLALAGPP